MNKLQQSSFKTKCTKATAIGLACFLSFATVPVHAQDTKSNGVNPTCDEAYYATMDYYGNYTEGSVVKSYKLNGATEITDYGTYDEVNNMCDGTEPASANGETKFTFDKDSVPDHFYFEGKTKKPFEEMPFDVTLSYTLNGVPEKAENLAGKTGVVGINIDILPNSKASKYVKNNYVLVAAAVFNEDDILSLKAEGAQLQLVGNIRTALYLALPGEEKHYTVEVGSNDFSFSGLTLLMVPATLEQLDQLADISKNKDDIEDDYNKINGSLDNTIDAMNDISSGLNSAATGLDELNNGREQISAGKGTIYDDIDMSKVDIGLLAELLKPFNEELQTTSKMLTDSEDSLKSITDSVLSLRKEIKDTRSTLINIKRDSKNSSVLGENVDDMRDTLNDLQTSLDNSNGMVNMPQTENMGDSLKLVNKIYTAFLQGAPSNGVLTEPNFNTVLTGIIASNIKQDVYDAIYQKCINEYHMSDADAVAAANSQTPAAATAKAQQIVSQGTCYSDGSYKNLCQAVLGLSGKDVSLADTMDSLNTAYNGGGATEADKAQLELLLSTMDTTMGNLNSTTSGVNSSLYGITDPTSKLVGQLSTMTSNLTELKGLLNDVGDLAQTGVDVSLKLENSLVDLENLEKTLDEYEPTLQKTISDVEAVNTKAQESLINAQKLITDAESLAKQSGKSIDKGTMDTLNGLSQSLKKTAEALDTNKGIKDAKDNMDSIITDFWNDHTGDVDNILNMDSTADVESLTSDKNPSPESVQLVLRTQEIKEKDEDESDDTGKTEEKVGFFGKIINLFKGLWNWFIGLFKKK